jgi:two-component system alkaline phosphatase synthesis response regulator PhoP
VTKARILVVDDDQDMVRGLEDNLALEEYEVLTAPDGETGLATALSQKPDLVILDIMMPGMDGLDVCRRLRRQNKDVRILLLTAKGQESDKVLGLELGADDYVSKPFGLLELLARVKAQLRRTSTAGRRAHYEFGEMVVDTVRREVTRADRLVELTAKEFDLLVYLLEHPGEALGRDHLLENIWGYEKYPTTRTVDNHILRLRKKLEPDPSHPRHFLTLHAVGYKFIAGD